MNTKRVPIKRVSRQISPAAIAAWHAADFGALHEALRLMPWERSPLPIEVTALGVSEAEPPDPPLSGYDASYPKAIKLQRALIAAVGWPDCRAAYEKILREAIEDRDYCRRLVEHPEEGGQGTGSDPASRLRALEEADEEVHYRETLLNKLVAT